MVVGGRGENAVCRSVHVLREIDDVGGWGVQGRGGSVGAVEKGM